MSSATPEPDIRAALRLIAEHYYGDRGLWTYEAFDYLNATYFAGKLPTTHLVWALTAYGGCLGYTRIDPGRPPVIVLHPSLFGGVTENPWDVPAGWLGARFVFDTLIHELIHVSVEYSLGGWRRPEVGGESSHNNPLWIAEVNRLAPLLGLAGVAAGMSVVKRVPIADAPPTKRGKPATKPGRVSAGNVPFDAVAGFPRDVRAFLKQADRHYRQLHAEPPFPATIPTPRFAPR